MTIIVLLVPVLLAVVFVLALLISPLLKTTDRPFRWARLPSFARRSLGGALVLLAWDGVLSGSFVFSVLFCPVWFLVSVLKNVVQRPGWGIALFRIAIPALTLGMVLGNSNLQSRIARANAERIISACEQYHVAHGSYPSKLEDLVPQYLESLPRAKYCIMMGEFHYWDMGDCHFFTLAEIPPFGRWSYTFERQPHWHYLD
jgi:hypothetical protein